MLSEHENTTKTLNLKYMIMKSSCLMYYALWKQFYSNLAIVLLKLSHKCLTSSIQCTQAVLVNGKGQQDSFL